MYIYIYIYTYTNHSYKLVHLLLYNNKDDAGLGRTLEGSHPALSRKLLDRFFIHPPTGVARSV